MDSIITAKTISIPLNEKVAMYVLCLILIIIFILIFHKLNSQISQLNIGSKIEKNFLMFTRDNIHYFTTISSLLYIILSVLLLDIFLMIFGIITADVGIPIITSVLGYGLANKTAEISQLSKLNGSNPDLDYAKYKDQTSIDTKPKPLD